jgi:hypothetical protein
VGISPIGEKAGVYPLENGVKPKGARLKWHDAGQDEAERGVKPKWHKAARLWYQGGDKCQRKKRGVAEFENDGIGLMVCIG